MKTVLFKIFLLLQVSWTDGVDWPDNTYGLPKTKAGTGCPYGWVSGGIKQDLEELSDVSSAIHMDVTLEGSGDINRKFCMKTNPGSGATKWPPGFYCIYKAKDSRPCPSGMTKGSVQWDDRDVAYVWQSANKQYGTFPDGVYGINTKIYYCCQDNDKKLSDQIELPIDRPFYLLPHNSTTEPKCQVVKGAISSLEHIDYDTPYVGSIDEGKYSHVFFKQKLTGTILNLSYMRVYYCYYKDGCSTITCPYGATCKVIGNVAECECDFTCSNSKSPVCGSDLKTYDNECKMKEAACNAKKDITVLGRDKCGYCSTITCPYGAITCKVFGGGAKCECDFTCSDSKSLVCGSDLNTYDNECKMKEAACNAKKYITKRKCDNPNGHITTPKSNGVSIAPIIGAVVGVVVLIALVLAVWYYCRRRKNKSPAPPVQFNATESGRMQIGQVSNDHYEDPDKMRGSISSDGFHNQAFSGARAPPPYCESAEPAHGSRSSDFYQTPGEKLAAPLSAKDEMSASAMVDTVPPKQLAYEKPMQADSTVVDVDRFSTNPNVYQVPHNPGDQHYTAPRSEANLSLEPHPSTSRETADPDVLPNVAQSQDVDYVTNEESKS